MRRPIAAIKQLQLEYSILGVLLAYAVLHLPEEGVFGFPEWAGMRWGIPNYTLERWLMHNAFFLVFLAAGYLVYRSNPVKWPAAGLGILIWGLLNSLNHIVFSLLFLEYSPGMVSGLAFAALGYLGLRQAHQTGRLTTGVVLTSVLAGLLYWGLPLGTAVGVDIALGF